MSEPQAQHELDAPPWLRVESTLMATARLIRRAFDDELAALGINLTGASLLMYVIEHGALTQSALAERLGIGRAAAGLVVDRLEEAGHVERLADVDDRRTRLVAATEAGRGLAVQIKEIDVAVRRRLRQGIDRDDRQQLASLLIQIQRNLTTENLP